MIDGFANGRSERPKERRRETRQRLILDVVIARGSCSAQDLASHFSVSLMTIHRALHELERRGVVRKFHGGVTAQPSAVFESQLSYRMTTKVPEKIAIAQAALNYVEPGMSIMLDDFTSALQMLPGLAQRAPLHVATTFLTALTRLTELPSKEQMTLIGLGGTYNEAHDSFAGIQCLEQIAAIRADVLFASTSAVSATDTFHQEELVVAIKRAMVRASTKRYLLVDNSKLGRVALHKIVPLDEFDLVITDAGADPAVLAAWATAGIPYEIAA